jgi:hypothetical protein
MFFQTKREGTNYILNEQRKKNEGGWFSGFFGKKKSKDSKAGIVGRNSFYRNTSGEYLTYLNI